MSWDVVLAPLPEDIASVSDLPRDHEPTPIGPVAEVLDRIRGGFPDADLSDPAWGFLYDADGAWSMELNIGAKDPVETVMLHIRGGGDVVPTALLLAELLGCRAVDCSDGGFLTLDGGSREAFQAYRDRVIRRPGD
ncbi:hypothetical protein PWG71_03675 [Nocardiopsis sp. N85]|uniref:hypothetical protein n=1 Tax=Nocardiopsis sp. N85 TaxID=3029400 RepID=UPI00237EFF2D|nr:hypothetical protein [Nocardiopsis sp. N85]MDE3720474.1 hypothetical protein [Nocardiopsis sp. N85]